MNDLNKADHWRALAESIGAKIPDEPSPDNADDRTALDTQDIVSDTQDIVSDTEETVSDTEETVSDTEETVLGTWGTVPETDETAVAKDDPAEQPIAETPFADTAESESHEPDHAATDHSLVDEPTVETRESEPAHVETPIADEPKQPGKNHWQRLAGLLGLSLGSDESTAAQISMPESPAAEDSATQRSTVHSTDIPARAFPKAVTTELAAAQTERDEPATVDFPTQGSTTLEAMFGTVAGREPERDEPERDEPERDEPERDEPERDEPERDELKPDEPRPAQTFGFGLIDAVEEEESAESQAGDEETSERRPRRRRGRRGRRRRGSRDEAPSSEEVAKAEIEPQDRSVEDAGADFDTSHFPEDLLALETGESLLDFEELALDDVDDTDRPRERSRPERDESSNGGLSTDSDPRRKTHRKIPSWLDAVGHVVDTNLESRKSDRSNRSGSPARKRRRGSGPKRRSPGG